MTSPVKLLIVDDHRVFAEGLQSVFRAEPDFWPVAAVSDPGQVLGVVAASQAVALHAGLRPELGGQWLPDPG